MFTRKFFSKVSQAFSIKGTHFNARKIPNENVKLFAIRKVKERNGDLKEAEEAINVLKRYSLISKLYWSNYYTNVS